MVIIKKKLLILLGNGFTMDLLGYIEKHENKELNVDVRNLFRFGADVRWPKDKKSSFLSHRNTPYLWNLGARPSNSPEESLSIIEEIVTCANTIQNAMIRNPAIQLAHDRDGNNPMRNTYRFAYMELAYYLRHLFIYYNDKVSIESTDLSRWKWTDILRRIADPSVYEEVTIVTYNYDIFLERILRNCAIDFNIAMKSKKSKISIVKPHGSISFYDKTPMITPNEVYMYKIDPKIKTVGVRYDNLSEPSFTNVIVPPAGESIRLSTGWTKSLRDFAIKKAQKLENDDDFIICGLSYWSVDRAETDEILTSINPKVNAKFINPSPPKELNAVLTSLFDNYECFNSANSMEVL